MLSKNNGQNFIDKRKKTQVLQTIRKERSQFYRQNKNSYNFTDKQEKNLNLPKKQKNDQILIEKQQSLSARSSKLPAVVAVTDKLENLLKRVNTAYTSSTGL